MGKPKHPHPFWCGFLGTTHVGVVSWGDQRTPTYFGVVLWGSQSTPTHFGVVLLGNQSTHPFWGCFMGRPKHPHPFWGVHSPKWAARRPPPSCAVLSFSATASMAWLVTQVTTAAAAAGRRLFKMWKIVVLLPAKGHYPWSKKQR